MHEDRDDAPDLQRLSPCNPAMNEELESGFEGEDAGENDWREEECGEGDVENEAANPLRPRVSARDPLSRITDTSEYTEGDVPNTIANLLQPVVSASDTQTRIADTSNASRAALLLPADRQLEPYHAVCSSAFEQWSRSSVALAEVCSHSGTYVLRAETLVRERDVGVFLCSQSSVQSPPTIDCVALERHCQDLVENRYLQFVDAQARRAPEQMLLDPPNSNTSVVVVELTLEGVSIGSCSLADPPVLAALEAIALRTALEGRALQNQALPPPRQRKPSSSRRVRGVETRSKIDDQRRWQRRVRMRAWAWMRARQGEYKARTRVRGGRTGTSRMSMRMGIGGHGQYAATGNGVVADTSNANEPETMMKTEGCDGNGNGWNKQDGVGVGWCGGIDRRISICRRGMSNGRRRWRWSTTAADTEQSPRALADNAAS